MIDLDQLEAKAKAATPGERKAGNWTVGIGDWCWEAFKSHEEMPPPTADAAFIAATDPSVVLELVAELRELRGIVADLAKIDPDGQVDYDPGYSEYTPGGPIYGCKFCYDLPRAKNEDWSPHRAPCIHRRAVEWQNRRV